MKIARIVLAVLGVLFVATPRVVMGFHYQDFSNYSVLAMTLEAASVVLLICLLRFSQQPDSR